MRAVRICIFLRKVMRMFSVAIFGTGAVSQTSRKYIEEIFKFSATSSSGNEEPVRVAAYWENQPKQTLVDGTAVLDVAQLLALYKKGVIQGVVLPRDIFSWHRRMAFILIQHGIAPKNIYITSRIENKSLTGRDMPSFLMPYLSAKFLPYLEFHIADQCNLNCKACEHYSGLVTTPTYPDFEKFSQDMQRLHHFIDDVGILRILGGEPLLNPEINKYMRLSRKLYPDAYIAVVTNALKLMSMPEDFFQTAREESIVINISLYPPMEKKIPEIKKMLEERHISCMVGPLMTKFEMKQTLKKDPTAGYFFQCFQAHCHNLYDGKLAACFLPFTTKYFNSYFKKKLQEDGAIDLYDETLTTEELKARLLRPFERCCYCKSAIQVDWEQISQPSVLSDWVIEE